MVDGFLLGYSKDAFEACLAYDGGILLESVQIRDIPLDKQLQSLQVDEASTVCNDACDKAVIALIAFQLALTVFCSGDVNGLQISAVQLRIKAQLPQIVHHVLWDADFELNVYLAPTLRDVPEPCDYNGRNDPVSGHHFAVFVGLGLHKRYGLSLVVLEGDILLVSCGRILDLSLGNLILGNVDAGLHLFRLYDLNVTGGSAAMHADNRNDNEYHQQDVEHEGTATQNSPCIVFPFIVVHIIPIIRALLSFFIISYELLEELFHSFTPLVGWGESTSIRKGSFRRGFIGSFESFSSLSNSHLRYSTPSTPAARGSRNSFRCPSESKIPVSDIFLFAQSRPSKAK